MALPEVDAFADPDFAAEPEDAAGSPELQAQRSITKQTAFNFMVAEAEQDLVLGDKSLPFVTRWLIRPKVGSVLVDDAANILASEGAGDHARDEAVHDLELVTEPGACEVFDDDALDREVWEVSLE